MLRRISIWTIVVCTHLFFAGTGWADVPPPPVNQTLGMPDVGFSNMAEADCRVCHSSGLVDEHHEEYGKTVDTSGSVTVPYPDTDGDGNDDTEYSCLSCHGDSFAVERDCLVCHTGDSPHHDGSTDCQSCHGSIVDNAGDGHYIPTYAPSLVTPSPSGGPGACDECHTAGGGGILSNKDLHHGTGLPGTVGCSLCHDMQAPADEKIRRCEDCHGPDSLHNIQADSPATGNVGTIVVGGEDSGYGHVGRDVPGDSDCWGCHGFTTQNLTAISGSIAPTLYNVRPAVLKAGVDTFVVLTGSAFTNTTGETLYESDAVLTAADGSSVTLTPGALYEGLLKVTVPGNTAPGNYKLRVVKTDDEGDPVISNAIGITVVREVIITDVTSDGIVTIEGNGFGGYAEGSGTSVTGRITSGNRTAIVEATIVSWSDTVIKADFGAASPEEVTVNSVFGTDTYSD